ncbi:MAG: phosphoribosylamine--glycine ligase [Bacteroidota bacterium]|nr:phosphoribosylamine--glycine ligase [Bacteroidota bacterium]
MKILILGSGGREHAIAWKITQSQKCEQCFIAPGNAGTASLGENIPIKPTDFEAIKLLCIEKEIQMLIVGPEDPLVNGIVDFFLHDAKLKNILIIGPDKFAAQLEGSKQFAKEFMKKYQIPTAGYFSATQENLIEANAFLDKQNPPFVLKADGLAAGKGVLIIENRDEAKASLKEMLDGKFGDASKTVVIEEFLDGIELSVFVLTDGKSYITLPEAKDYKRIGEKDTGLNTGGMGSISPVPFADNEFMKRIENKIIKPTIHGIESEGMNYKGFVFFGLIKVKDEPYVIEYNVRMGDPETESVIPRIKSDLTDLLIATASRSLKNITVDIDKRTAATVMLVSGGYPKAYSKGEQISGLDNAEKSILFHAGTKTDSNKIRTAGGRVLAVTSLASDMKKALALSYQTAETIQFNKKYYRKDIGFDL